MKLENNVVCNFSEDENCNSENINDDDDDIPAVIDVEEFISVGFKNSSESGKHVNSIFLFKLLNLSHFNKPKLLI